MKKNISILIFTLCLCNGAILLPSFHSGQAFAQTYNFRTYSLEEGLVQSQIPSICQDNDGNMWIGTFGGGVSKFNGQTFQTYNTTDGFINNDIRVILLDSQGNIWFGTREGVSKLIINNDEKCLNDSLKSSLCIQNFSIKDGLAGNYIESIFEDSKGNMWFAAVGRGVSMLKPDVSGKSGVVFQNFDIATVPRSWEYFAIIEDSKGNIWIGGGIHLNKEGLCVYDGKELKNFTTKDGLMHNDVRDILQDSEGKIWIATASGLSNYLYNKNVFENITGGKIFYPLFEIEDSVMIGRIFEDSKGFLWFSSADKDGVRILARCKVNNFSERDFQLFTTIQHAVENFSASKMVQQHLKLLDKSEFETW
ncbi:MAG: hypothetical protein IIA88_02985 [Bacteroidetes bacterium]|nr:hypothetical protein [Bacteroidota bacterium]